MDERIKTGYREDVHMFSIATTNAYYTENKWILEDLLRKSLLAKHGKYSQIDIQFEILSHLISSDSALHKYLRWKDLLSKAVKSLKRNHASIDRVKKAQKRIEFMQNSAIAVRLFMGQLRSIGDGFAWWFLNYDRAALRLLAEHDYVSIPLLGPGLYKEIYECSELLSQGKPFLLNSITNFIRIGDITTFDESDNSIKLIEVKAGRLKTPRVIRQGKHLSIVQEGLKKGEHSVFGDIAITKIESNKPLLTYIKSLESAMLEAKENLASSRIFGEYLTIAVFYLRKIVDIPELEAKRISDNTMGRCMSIIGRTTDIVIPFIGNVLHTIHFSRMLAPYTIFPISYELRFALMAGDFSIISQINISGLTRWLKKRGWKAEELPFPEKAPDLSKSPYLPILRVFKPNSPLGVEIPLDIICAAAMEFWMPESIERMIIAILDNRNRKKAYSVNFPNIGKYAWD